MTSDGLAGLWLRPRKDAGNAARSDPPGAMRSARREVWRSGGTAPYRFVREVALSGARHFPARVEANDGTVRVLGSSQERATPSDGGRSGPR